MVHYVIVEPANGKLELSGVPPVYEIGELIPAARPELEGVAPVLYCAEHPDEQLPALYERATLDRERGTPPAICAVIESGKATGRVQQHLADRMILPNPSSGDAVLRYYDPRVFPHLRRILNAAQMEALLGPVAAWSWFDLTGDWITVSGGSEPETEFAVSLKQFEQIARIELVQRALDVLRDNKTSTKRDAPALLDAELCKGEAYGLAGADLLAFALHGALVSPYFDRHPRVRAVLQRTQEASYAEVVSAWSASDWEVIARESIQYQ
jgi:hypothetical protein